MSDTPNRLLIVYNAEAGIPAGIKDSIHKLLRPATYPCSLCALTHGTLRMDRNWKRFLDRVPLDVRIYHRTDFRARYPELDLPLPAVLTEQGQVPRLLLGAEELRTIESVEALIALVEAKLA